MGSEALKRVQSAAKALQPTSVSTENELQTAKKGGFQFHPEISLRISWLELQMTIVLLVSKFFFVLFFFVFFEKNFFG